MARRGKATPDTDILTWAFQAKAGEGQNILDLLDLVQAADTPSSASIQTDNASLLKIPKEGSLLIKIQGLPASKDWIFFSRSRANLTDRFSFNYAMPKEDGEDREIQFWCSQGTELSFYAGCLFGGSLPLFLSLKLRP